MVSLLARAVPYHRARLVFLGHTGIIGLGKLLRSGQKPGQILSRPDGLTPTSPVD